MISELRICDLGVIEDATIELHPGLTVVTGETGAGKTMIVNGIGLLLGDRADPKAVRSGADRARVEGTFAGVSAQLVDRIVANGGELDGEEVLVARQVTSAGRSRCWLGGAQIPVGQCAGIVSELVDIYGQSEQALLAQADRQRMLLDRFAGPELASVLTEYRDRWSARRQAATELEELRVQAQARAREIDLLRFGLEEISQVAPQPGEDVALAAEALRLQSIDDLRSAAQAAVLALSGDDGEAEGAVSSVGLARKVLEQAAEHDQPAADLAQRAAEVLYNAQELAHDVARYLDQLEVEPRRLEWIGARRAELASLFRKYGNDGNQVLAWAEDAARRLAGLTGADDRIEQLSVRVAEADQVLAELADRISALRKAAAQTFAEQVSQELVALAMPNAQLIFALHRLETLGPHGRESVELLFSANPGTEPRSLARVASGGELSRVRLALEVVLADDARGRTLVFDEVDAGVGGAVAVEIGRRLAVLARRTQVIVVTHLAQVAAFADRHFVVAKSSDGQVTTSGVTEVREDDRAEELARMMAGIERSESALAHARELVEVASTTNTTRAAQRRPRRPKR